MGIKWFFTFLQALFPANPTADHLRHTSHTHTLDLVLHILDDPLFMIQLYADTDSAIQQILF